jgi:hypothetical protein
MFNKKFSSPFTLHNFTRHKKCSVPLYELFAVRQVTSFSAKKMLALILVFVKVGKLKWYTLFHDGKHYLKIL